MNFNNQLKESMENRDPIILILKTSINNQEQLNIIKLIIGINPNVDVINFKKDRFIKPANITALNIILETLKSKRKKLKKQPIIVVRNLEFLDEINISEDQKKLFNIIEYISEI